MKIDWTEVILKGLMALGILWLCALLYLVIFVEEVQTLRPHCGDTPYYTIRESKDWLHEDIGTIRMTTEEAKEECGNVHK